MSERVKWMGLVDTLIRIVSVLAVVLVLLFVWNLINKTLNNIAAPVVAGEAQK